MYICIKLLTNQNFKMKKLAYLFIAGLAMFAFTACGGGQTTTEEAVPVAEESTDVVEEDTIAVKEDTTAVKEDTSVEDSE